jgi:hypothetical protein
MRVAAAHAPRFVRPPSTLSPGLVKKFLTTPTSSTPEGRPAVFLLAGHVTVNDELVNAHSVLQPGGLKPGVAAPAWLKPIAGDPMKVHRASQFALPDGHSLWFVESSSYKAGWFVDGSQSPMFINQPGVFRRAKPHENIFPTF